ncbi:MAG: efflux RND transporter periplasmic adaptor subunit, partial [Candidatus Saganbacteria bacterium]|nr:efflux RND transporter periplasmic adaptor subunit [Candidatus Saganbacteria bacterium]
MNKNLKYLIAFVLIGVLAFGVYFAYNTINRVPQRKILYYQSGMHPWITSDKPGKCPICGM